MKLRRGLILLFSAGILGTTLLVAYYGAGTILDGVFAVGWGLGAIALLHLVPMLCSSLGWQALLQGTSPVAFGWYLWARWIREAIDGLLPVGQIGGEFVGAHLLARRGLPTNLALTGCVLDLTMEVVTQFCFGLLGLGLLVFHHGYDGTVYWLMVGLAVTGPALAGFILAQRLGLYHLIERALVKLADLLGFASIGGMAGLHDAAQILHRDRRGMAWSFLWHSLSWVLGASEIWLALKLLGHPVGIAEAIILESLGQAVRSAAFLVPGALGVQEGGYILLGGLVGLGPEIGLMLSLVKRVRELLLGLPALAAWQIVEGRGYLRRAPAPSAVERP